jgi:hypothetical protein
VRFRLPLTAALILLLLTVLVAGGWWLRYGRGVSQRSRQVMAWLRTPQAHPDWGVRAGTRCGAAPFTFPTDGYIGFLWDDSFRPGHRHQGIDIFGGQEPGLTPVQAAYGGFLTRRPDWKSSLIIRIPADPLQPDRQIWAYYTHLADPAGSSLISAEFPPGVSEIPVVAGQFLGYQGNFSGTPDSPVGVHLHFSLVQDDHGAFLNELKLANTLDPSPYFGFNLNAHQNRGEIPQCAAP